MATVVRSNEPTPHGGAYSELTYLDDHYHVVDETQATRCVIRECDEKGNTIREIWGYPK